MAIPGSRYQDQRRKTWATIKANARLIAAAPELLEACQAYVDAFDNATGTVYLIDEMRAAIAKAKGGAA